MRLIDADALIPSEVHTIIRLTATGEQTESVVYAEDIDNAPTVEPMRWIPVTERLPEELQEVNITWVNTNPESYYEFIKGKPFTGSAVYYKGRWNWYSAVCVDYLREYGFSPNDEMDDAIKVLAWMPLPEPWKGVANE